MMGTDEIQNENTVLDECRKLALRESEVEPIEALRKLTECYMDNCGISRTARTVIYDAAEHWLRRLRNSNHPLAVIAGKGMFTEFMPYINKEYCDNHEHYNNYDICALLPDKDVAIEVVSDFFDSYMDEATKIAFAVGFLKAEQYYDNKEEL